MIQDLTSFFKKLIKCLIQSKNTNVKINQGLDLFRIYGMESFEYFIIFIILKNGLSIIEYYNKDNLFIQEYIPRCCYSDPKRGLEFRRGWGSTSLIKWKHNQNKNTSSSKQEYRDHYTIISENHYFLNSWEGKEARRNKIQYFVVLERISK